MTCVLVVHSQPSVECSEQETFVCIVYTDKTILTSNL